MHHEKMWTMARGNRNKMAAVRINTMGGQKEIREEFPPGHLQSNNALKFCSGSARKSCSMRSRLWVTK